MRLLGFYTFSKSAVAAGGGFSSAGKAVHLLIGRFVVQWWTMAISGTDKFNSLYNHSH